MPIRNQSRALGRLDGPGCARAARARGERKTAKLRALARAHRMNHTRPQGEREAQPWRVIRDLLVFSSGSADLARQLSPSAELKRPAPAIFRRRAPARRCASGLVTKTACEPAIDQFHCAWSAVRAGLGPLTRATPVPVPTQRHPTILLLGAVRCTGRASVSSSCRILGLTSKSFSPEVPCHRPPAIGLQPLAHPDQFHAAHRINFSLAVTCGFASPLRGGGPGR